MTHIAPKLLKACFEGFVKTAPEAKAEAQIVETAVAALLVNKKPFLENSEAFIKIMEAHETFDRIHGIIYDIFCVNYLEINDFDDDYWESEEWEAIEELTFDNGTELFNVITYLKECLETDVEPEMDDFLEEYLLIEDEDFQEEVEIYESLIKHREVEALSYEKIAKIAQELDDDDPIWYIFYPVMCFFYEQAFDVNNAEYEKHNFEGPEYTAIMNVMRAATK